MPYQKFENSLLNLLGLFNQTETPVLSDQQTASGASGLSLGQAAINNIDKRFWIGMGKYQAPIEISNVILLNQTGATPSTSTIYNAGTLIINTIDNLAWVGTGNTETNESFVSINGGGGVSSLDGGTF
jgi:hypothetical protein